MNRSNRIFGARFYAIASLLAAFVIPGVFLVAQKPSFPKEKTVSLKGRPLARVGYLTGYLRGTFGDRYEVFIFGLDSKSHDHSIAAVKVMYKFFYKTEPALPGSFLDASKHYTLRVIRDPNCDETVESLSYQKNIDESGKSLPSSYILEPLNGASLDALKPNLLLPCYELRPDRYKALN